ncbi:GIY-YIG nuclease family protein [Pandoraea oxalativorans]|uniref:GIY-YIG nuclease family protein n=1 Tax=Pandoraea oxalativorans TaxID=573737 RepID=UPI0009FE0E2C|nr:GIY-YIG nuclease family protein [Pandoraea oxalativorans]
MTVAAPKPWYLYLLECAGGRIYTGITVDVEARYAAHVAGKGARFTRAYPPSRVLLSLSFSDRSTASRAEYRIKQLSASQKRGLIAGTYACDFSDLATRADIADRADLGHAAVAEPSLKAPDAPVE